MGRLVYSRPYAKPRRCDLFGRSLLPRSRRKIGIPGALRGRDGGSSACARISRDAAKAINGRSPATRLVPKHRARATCRICASLGRGVAGTIRLSPPNASRLQIRELLVDEVAPFLAQTKRVGAVQVLEADNEIRTKMDQARVTGQADGSADWAIRVDAAREEDIAGAVARLQELRAWKDLGLMGTATIGSYRLLYSISSN